MIARKNLTAQGAMTIEAQKNAKNVVRLNMRGHFVDTFGEKYSEKGDFGL